MVQKEALKGASESLFSLLESQRKELEAWEADLSRREELLQTAGNGALPGDILYLNVGGRTGIAVQRSTLTSIEKSVLSAKFSKNWEDGLDLDKDGNIFVDQNPDLFLTLVNYLRSRKNTSPHGGVACSPPVSSDFDRMLQHYEAMLGVYPTEILPIPVSTEEDAAAVTIRNYPDFSISTDGFRTFDLCSVGHDRMVREFTITTGEFSELVVGWRDVDKVASSYVGNFFFSVGLNVTKCIEVFDGEEGPAISSLFGAENGVTIRIQQSTESPWSWSWTKLADEDNDKKSVATKGRFKNAQGYSIPCISVKGTVKIIDIQYVCSK